MLYTVLRPLLDSNDHFRYSASIHALICTAQQKIVISQLALILAVWRSIPSLSHCRLLKLVFNVIGYREVRLNPLCCNESLAFWCRRQVLS